MQNVQGNQTHYNASAALLLCNYRKAPRIRHLSVKKATKRCLASSQRQFVQSPSKLSIAFCVIKLQQSERQGQVDSTKVDMHRILKTMILISSIEFRGGHTFYFFGASLAKRTAVPSCMWTAAVVSLTSRQPDAHTDSIVLFPRWVAHQSPLQKYACWLSSASCQHVCRAACVAICAFGNSAIWCTELERLFPFSSLISTFCLNVSS